MVHTKFKETLNALREEVTASNSHLIVAVDIGKFTNCACFRISDGKVLRKQFNFHNDIGGFNALMNQVHYYEGSRIKCLKKAKNWVIYLIKGCSLKT